MEIVKVQMSDEAYEMSFENITAVSDCVFKVNDYHQADFWENRADRRSKYFAT